MRWTMFIGARILQAVLDGTSKEQYAGWISRFHAYVLASVGLDSEFSRLRAQLSSLQDLSLYYHLVSHSSAGYSLFKKAAPVFTQFVSQHPHLWTPDSNICLDAVLHTRGFNIPRFAFFDAIYSLAFGVAPLIHYDTNQPRPAGAEHFHLLEWIFGCPPDIVIALAKVNAWRASQRLEQTVATPMLDEWQEIEERLQTWRPTVEHIDEPLNVVARLAVFEGWRQAALIYLYMGMCGVNSADPRVESCVRQVIQLACTIQPGAPAEPYMMLPCLIAGVAARLEKHRAVIYKKLSTPQTDGILALRGSDFLPVMDNLWHGAGTDGTPVIWENYVRARLDSDYEAEDYPVPDDLESYVYSPAFDEECAIEFRKARAGASHSYVSNPESADALWSPVAPTTSSLSSVGSSPHDPSPLEAKYYYFGISSSGRGSVGGPRLLFRTSKDRWVPSTGPDTYPRTMRLCDVPEDHQLAKNPSLWDPIRNQVVELLKNGNIQFSTVTLVCFTWLEKKEKDDDEENEEEEEEKDNDNDNEKKENDDDGEQDDLEAEFDRMPLVKAVEEGERYTTPPTIWVGVLPNTLSGTTANDLATEILGIVSQYNLTSVEVAFCESEAQLLSGSTLFTPVDDDDDHKEVIDNLSTALPLSIAGKKTSMQGTLTCFFRVGKELYAITARHNLFNNGKDDEEYTYVDSAPKKQVIVMGPDTFNNYLAFIQAKISNLNNTVAYLVVRDDRLKQEVAEDLNNNEPAGKLEKTVEQLAGLRARISMLKAFYVNVARRWSKVNDRVIGYVASAPKIDVSVPHSYTRDF
ncbi:hypothetical protein FS749_009900, partial [Ceratobasidium sp. UAMH 11750]